MAVYSCLERGGLAQWRGLMRVVWADPDGPIAAHIERALADSKSQALGPRDQFEGGITEATWWLWHVYLRDGREWRAAHPLHQGGQS